MNRLVIIGNLLIALVVYALVVHYRQDKLPLRCSFDGTIIYPRHQVSILQQDGRERDFSCVLTAWLWWRENSDLVSSILVTDEATGKKIKAADAFYVVSQVITTPHTGNKIHVFGQESVAARHARQFNGTFVKNPFHAQERIPVRMIACKPYSPDGAGCALNWSEKEPIIADGPACFQEQAPCGLPHPYRRCWSEGYHSAPYRPPKVTTTLT